MIPLNPSFSQVKKKTGRPDRIITFSEVKKPARANKNSLSAEIRKQTLIEKYNCLKESRKLSLFLDKRRKRNATKDHRYMPYRRADASEQ
ncbi:hypothetical protein Bca52824_013173 [Brassica carinata]|uniref:Uncharacterized protein n=1 Tax=Brassica carinata TaxID=52824 RepID=A0A8X8B286_BRACI|nr:hypothetical protein Bca52824_013173 [Brassica carinata]